MYDWFLKMNKNQIFNKRLVRKVKQMIKNSCSPRHIPEVILETNGIPYTMNGKKVEVAIRKIIHGKKVDNIESLRNPEVLNYYKNISELST